LSLKPVSDRLAQILGREIRLIQDYIDGPGEGEIANAQPGSINYLENIRFYHQEEANDPEFSQRLAGFADVYVNDAFGVAHRTHASNVGVTEYLPSGAGFLMEKEVEIISQTVEDPQRPMIAILGGAKAEHKIPQIEHLLEKADTLIVGGGVANAFFKAWGHSVGRARVRHEMVELAHKLIWKAARGKTRLLLPSDVVLGDLKNDEYSGVAKADQIPENLQALDIGPKTQVEFGNAIAEAKTIIWNGPMGVYESQKFSVGTDFIYHSLAENKDALTIVGGGDTITAIKKEEYLATIDHVSTGGGAMLEYIESGSLPAIEVLVDKDK
jgi:3-phosphoglycerate kinase